MALKLSELYSIQNEYPSVDCTQSYGCTTCAQDGDAGCENCYKNAYCQNKEYGDKLSEIERLKLTKNQEYSDINLVYQGEIVKTANLIIGIIGICSFIFYSK
jgi:hypothetical protein